MTSFVVVIIFRPSLMKRGHLNISWWLCLQDVLLILRSIFFLQLLAVWLIYIFHIGSRQHHSLVPNPLRFWPKKIVAHN
jgi:hypothetical protein